jgi:hypothetical protein
LPENTETKTENKKPEPTPQASPTPQFVSQVKPEPVRQVSPTPENTEPKTDSKKSAPTSANTPKPLFEPIIISVGKTETPKTESKPGELSENKPAEEKPSETVQKTEPAETSINETKTPEKPTDEKLLSGENRPRIIITDNTGAKTVTEEISTCKLMVSPASLSLLNGGGSLGVEVMFENEGKLTEISAGSSSPGDVQVTLDPEIGKGSKKLFFIVKSVSKNIGVFTITFEAPCGRKEILVKVR